MGRTPSYPDIIDYVRCRDIDIPIFAIAENRRDVRLSFTKKGINLRYPNFYRENELRQQLQWCKEWAIERIRCKPALLVRYESIHYSHGSVIPIFGNHWTLHLTPAIRKNVRHTFQDQILSVLFPAGHPLDQTQIKHIITHHIKARFTTALSDKTHWINQQTVKENIKSVSLKYYTGRWGSCTGDSRIQYSSRIVLLPERIQNMIILHELCHLVHFDHSVEYYDLVYHFMSDYDERDTWLKKYEHVYDY